MAEEVKTGTETEVNKTGTETNTETNKKPEQNVDVEKVKSDAVAEMLKSLGVESTDGLKTIIDKHNKDEEANKSDLQKAQDKLKQVEKDLLKEREAKEEATAKWLAVELGAKKEYVEDLVIIAKSKVTKDKDMNAVLAEIKESATGAIYFETQEEQNKEGSKKENTTVTRKDGVGANNTEQNKEGSSNNNNNNGKYAGTIAERLFANKNKETKSSYFSK